MKYIFKKLSGSKDMCSTWIALFLFWLIVGLCIAILPSLSLAKGKGTIRVIDGDTIVRTYEEVIRIDGIDAPEIGSAQCEEERMQGLQAKARVEELLSSGKKVKTLSSGDKDSFGRTLAEVYVDGVNVGEVLIKEGYAVPYDRREEKRKVCGG